MGQTVAVAVPLALGAAFLHALWNVLLKTSGDPLRVSARAIGSATGLATPFFAAAWLPTGGPGSLTGGAWILAATSALVELVYYICLSEAYRRGDLSVLYALARGTAPLLAVLAGLILLGSASSPSRWSG